MSELFVVHVQKTGTRHQPNLKLVRPSAHPTRPSVSPIIRLMGSAVLLARTVAIIPVAGVGEKLSTASVVIVLLCMLMGTASLAVAFVVILRVTFSERTPLPRLMTTCRVAPSLTFPMSPSMCLPSAETVPYSLEGDVDERTTCVAPVFMFDMATSSWQRLCLRPEVKLQKAQSLLCLLAISVLRINSPMPLPFRTVLHAPSETPRVQFMLQVLIMVRVGASLVSLFPTQLTTP